ncbi:sulfotransferase [Candidatus Poribacteria bacterium]|nr:sulfotransferase [Candidatus Poribacteria bacterium]
MKPDKMFFVVGNSRSGTTMMGRILGKHSDVYTFGELHFFGQLWSPASSSELDKQKAEKMASQLLCIQREGYRTHGKPSSFLPESRRFLSEFAEYPVTPDLLFSAFLHYETLRNSKTIPCDQTPRNVFYIDNILQFYPQAKIINMIRDPRDVLLSQKQKWKRRFLGGTDMPMKETLRDWINYHPITISRIWQTAVSAADKFADNERVISIYFEKLLTSPEATVYDVCQFTGIDYATAMIQVPQVGSSVNTDKPDQLGINPTRASNWQFGQNGKKDADLIPSENRRTLSNTEIYISQKINRTLMEKHNYVSISIRPNVFSLVVNILAFPIKLAAAFVCNLDRIKNIRETIKRRL